jgi:glycerol-3-phosphate acyltransferase PlsY
VARRVLAPHGSGPRHFTPLSKNAHGVLVLTQPYETPSNTAMLLYVLPFAAYLIGSISSAIIVARAMGLQDPREVGSRNPGATNILRYGGKTAAALTLLGDVLKGVIPVLIARAFTSDPAILAATAGGAFLGHLFPVFFGFHGGKGVATALGVSLALNPWLGLLLVATWIVMAAVFRYSSLSALAAALAAPFYTWWLMPHAAYVVMMVGMSALLIYRHRNNIRNLLAGKEGRIGEKRTGSEPTIEA